MSIEDDVVAVGVPITPENVLLAYQNGIFPWPHEGYPIMWFCPDPRFVLPLDQIHISQSLKKEIRRGRFRVKADAKFSEVIAQCASRKRPEQEGTWINEPIITAYTALHEQGFAHSIEAYEGDRLVGGLYGLSLGGVFFGESMFSLVPNASKVAFATLLAQLIEWNFDFVDCQSETEHLERFGAVHWPRDQFLSELRKSLEKETYRGRWGTLGGYCHGF